jgi:hypothetical protein
MEAGQLVRFRTDYKKEESRNQIWIPGSLMPVTGLFLE